MREAKGERASMAFVGRQALDGAAQNEPEDWPVSAAAEAEPVTSIRALAAEDIADIADAVEDWLDSLERTVKAPAASPAPAAAGRPVRASASVARPAVAEPEPAPAVEPAPAPLPAPAAPPRREPWVPLEALNHPIWLAALAIALVFGFAFFRLGGSTYYGKALGIRGYDAAHRVLRPSGSVGEMFGIVGAALILLTFFYTIRKKSKKLARLGNLKIWLEVHIFCGVVGPALVTLHTSFKFNGIVSVAYWLMVLVALSGFVGRYLFVRIPKTIRGKELDRSELEERATELKQRLFETTLPVSLLTRIETLERETLALVSGRPSLWRRLLGRFRVRRQMAGVRRQILRSGMEPDVLHEALDVIGERAALLQRIAHLNRRKELFALWHVFHKPLVYLMFLILVIHIAVALYFGYTPTRLVGGHP